MKTKYISRYNSSEISVEFLKMLLKYTAINCPFSTFGYIKGNNSEECLEKTNSGNCIALSMFLKNILNRYGIISYLIPASVPEMYKHPQYLDLSHVALCIPYATYAYILDPAFYFMEPMVVNVHDLKNTYSINSFNIYSNKKMIIDYKFGQISNKINLNSYQSLDEYIFCVESNYRSNPTDKWFYYLTEIVNPDQAITNFYISIKRFPFTTILNEDYSIRYLIKFLDKNTLLIKENNKIIFEGDPKKMSLDLLKKLAPYKLNFLIPKNIEYLEYNF